METIIADALPAGSFRLQPTLSNGRRPDCIVQIPGTDRGIVVDAKFPLEGFEALRTQTSADERKAAERLIREHVGRHIDDIAGKYLIAGETADTALMFVPSEGIYAELHEKFPDLMQKAHRANVAIVSPNLLMMAVHTTQMILRDARLRENAGAIQKEVGLLVTDLGRLSARLGDLDRHFRAASQDLDRARLSAEKVMTRGERIASAEVGDKHLATTDDRPQAHSAGGAPHIGRDDTVSVARKLAG